MQSLGVAHWAEVQRTLNVGESANEVGGVRQQGVLYARGRQNMNDILESFSKGA